MRMRQSVQRLSPIRLLFRDFSPSHISVFEQFRMVEPSPLEKETFSEFARGEVRRFGRSLDRLEPRASRR